MGKGHPGSPTQALMAIPGDILGGKTHNHAEKKRIRTTRPHNNLRQTPTQNAPTIKWGYPDPTQAPP